MTEKHKTVEELTEQRATESILRLTTQLENAMPWERKRVEAELRREQWRIVQNDRTNKVHAIGFVATADGDVTVRIHGGNERTFHKMKRGQVLRFKVREIVRGKAELIESEEEFNDRAGR